MIKKNLKIYLCNIVGFLGYKLKLIRSMFITCALLIQPLSVRSV